ncbi:hypothetical protein [Nocardioides maradonensis]
MAITATGCSGSSTRFADGGPLVSGTQVGVDCVPETHSGQATEGSHAIGVSPSDQLTVQAVKLLTPRGFELQQTYLVPITGTTLMGDSGRFPPSHAATSLPGVHWDRRVAVGAGTQIPTATATYEVVLHLKQTGPDPTVDGVEIDYTTAQGGSYRWQGHFGLRIAASCN